MVYPWIAKFCHWVSSLSKLEMEIWNQFAAKFSQIATQNFIGIKFWEYFGICVVEHFNSW